MMSAHTIADTNPTRAHLRLVVLGQWIAAGIALARAAAMGRGLVGGAVTLWRLAQAVRLAILLARRFRDAADAPHVGAPHVGAPDPASTPVPAWCLEDAPIDEAALRRAMAELDAAIADALGAAPHGGASLWDREPPGSLWPRAILPAHSSPRHPHGRETPPRGQRPLRPPGPERPFRRRWRTPGAPNAAPTPIATLAVGRDPLARA